MKTANGFRFSLQWDNASEEKVQVGEFLESLGYKKSGLVVIAVTEYLQGHPEMLASGHKSKVIVRPGLTLEQVRAVVQAMIEEKLAGRTVERQISDDSKVGLAVTESDVDEMLSNLDLFI